jgi:hypothetical protein
MINVTLFVFKLVYKNFGKKLDFAPKIDPKICNPKIAPKILDPKKFWIPASFLYGYTYRNDSLHFDKNICYKCG